MGGLGLLVIVGLAVALVVALNNQGTAAPAPSSARPAVAATPVKAGMLGTVSMPRYAKPRTAYDTANWKLTGTGGCEGIGGYNDMALGTSVTVYDGSGKIVGVSSLVIGVRHGQHCEWAFGVPDLPDVPFYQVEVSHRGKVAVEKADLGAVALTLGD
ncbi:MAG: hypothetical protein JWL97_4288 [Gemmatimonadales bacterium]|nr:hypothetical protein [Gemmatimonadales bacterium]